MMFSGSYFNGGKIYCPSCEKKEEEENTRLQESKKKRKKEDKREAVLAIMRKYSCSKGAAKVILKKL